MTAAPAVLPTRPGVPASASVLLPSGAPVVWPSEPADAQRALGLPPGSPVALADRRAGGRARLRRAAERLGVEVESEYVVLPTWSSATFVAADDRDAVTWLLSTFLTTPPRVVRGRLVLEAVRRVVAAMTRTRAGAASVRLVLGALVPGRLVVGVRR
ncbi:hypothetical protein [Intrasporangium flavum]|uniref:hypothetical protein n=1 Tax=Intrasporangium flavum TaxID=1428657 RepID=UPI00096E8889|nr:hypothetical protein [Intrasporangium flavum]